MPPASAYAIFPSLRGRSVSLPVAAPGSLAADDSSAMTNQSYVVDGGWV